VLRWYFCVLPGTLCTRSTYEQVATVDSNSLAAPGK
jgi:hypothetical protein